MKIGIIGATGKAGQEIVKETQSRGHEVTAIVRDAQKVTDSSVAVIEKDVFHLQAEDIKGFDVIVNAFGAPAGKEHLHVEAGKKLIEIFKEVPDTRLIVVGGAGSLLLMKPKPQDLWTHQNFHRSISQLLHSKVKT